MLFHSTRVSRLLAIEHAPTPPIAAALPLVGCHPLVGFVDD